MFRYVTAGESHGQALVATIEGLPAHVQISLDEIRDELARRRLGVGRGARMKFEADHVSILTGCRHGETLGSPIALVIDNSEWSKWDVVMSAEPVDADVLAGLSRNAPLTRPRPGHADLAGMQKYDWDEARPILERASARETAARVALGTLAKAFLRQTAGIEILSHVVQLGDAANTSGARPTYADRDTVDDNDVRCFDHAASEAMRDEVNTAKKEGDTLGGVFEVLAYGVPAGLGSHTQGDRRLDGKLAGALMGIQAIKAVALGDGFDISCRGSVAHDEIEPGPARVSNRSGGVEGGMSTGELLRVRAIMKPISTVPRPLRTIDTTTGEAARAHHQRSDVCAVPAAAVVAESMVALVLAEAMLEKFGGDSVAETKRNLQAYLDRLRERGLA